MKSIHKIYLLLVFSLTLGACSEDFLETPPLADPSDATFWTSYDNAVMWINYAYRDLAKWEDYSFEPMSDNCAGPGRGNCNLVANGTFESTTNIVSYKWGYTYIRHCLELLEKLPQIPNLTEQQKNELNGQARFIIAFRYYEMITLYRDVPLVDKVLTMQESDIPKSDKSVVLDYLLQQLNLAINELPVSWPAAQAGRATKGAALALKARVMLYNNRWEEAATAAKAVMDLKENGAPVYSLHPNYNELFLTSFNNKTKEVILAHQYAENLYTHTMCFAHGFYTIGGTSSSMPLPDLVNSYECNDGLPITESPKFDPNDPWENRDPRFKMTFIVPFETFAGVKYDPVNKQEDALAAKTYIYFKKYIADMYSQQRSMWDNWIIFRYADILLMYAEAKNEASGPESSVYDALDEVRKRAGMPVVDRARYNTQELLRALIRNERRVELAGEGLRYQDIIRWRIAEDVLNKEIFSYEIPGVLPIKNIEERVFKKEKHYVWPIPQSAIDNAKNLKQHDEWLK